MHYPGVFEGGLRIDYPTIGVDVAPTIASIAGAAIPSVWSGVALGPEAPETDRPIWVPLPPAGNRGAGGHPPER